MTEPLLSGLPTAPNAPNIRHVDDGELLRPGQIIAGRYQVRERLGRGGMGAVWRVHDQTLDEDVALKVILPDRMGDPGALARFRDEVKIARKITHNNVCRVFDIGESDNLAFLTMELVEGTTLRKFIANGPIETNSIPDMLRQIIAGVAAAHAHGIIHRDIKPENVLVRVDGRCVVADFGLAYRPDTQKNDVIAGTPAYMSPEQLHGEPLDVRSDVFALGLLAFELLSGHGPDSVREMIDAGDLPRLDRVTEPMQTALRAVILRAVAPKPQDRFDSATAFGAALSSAWETEHRSARDAMSQPEAFAPTVPAMPARVRKSSKNRWLLGIPLVLVAFAAAGFASRNAFQTSHDDDTDKRTPERTIAPEIRADGKPSAVVLPFDNLTNDDKWGGLSRSAHATVRDALRTIPEMVVVEGDGASKGAEAFRVRGSVQLTGDKPRIVVHVEATSVVGDALRSEPVEIPLDTDETKTLATLRQEAIDETRLLFGHWRKRQHAANGTKNEEARAKLLQYLGMVGPAPRRQHVEAGMALLDAALKLDAEYLPALVERAYLRTVGGPGTFAERVASSIIDLETANKVAPDDPDAAVMRCRVRQVATIAGAVATDEQIRNAREACQRALQLAPTSAYVYVALARLNDMVCQDDEAILLLEQSLVLDRGLQGRVLNHLVDYTLFRDQINVADRMSAAMVALQQEEERLGARSFSQRAGGSPVRHAHWLRGVVLLRREQAEDARREFEQELASFTAETADIFLEAAALRGVVKADGLLRKTPTSDVTLRLKQLEAQFRSDMKKTPEIALLVGEAYSRVDPEAAVEWLERTVAGSSCTATVQRSLVYFKAGKRDLARHTLDVCAPTQEWERSCMSEVRRLVGD